MIGASLLACAVARADDAPLLDLRPATFSMTPAPRETPPRFGEADTWWWSIGGGVADDFVDSTDVNLHGSVGWFIARNIELNAELGVWSYTQPDEDAFGINPNIILRWHWLNTGSWTLYSDVGIGVLFTNEDVPHRGTTFNFTPRLGGGVTYQIADNGARLQLGLRWAHVSNARLQGNDDNPGRDSVMIYAGVIFPF